jgi:hypothetical protein
MVMNGTVRYIVLWLVICGKWPWCTWWWRFVIVG